MKDNKNDTTSIVVIDLMALTTSNLSINEFLTLVGIHTNVAVENVREELFDELQSKRFLTFEGFKPVLTTSGKALVERFTSTHRSLQLKPARKVEVVQPFSDEFIEKYRTKFKGLKPGSMGYAKAVTVKMIRFFEEHKNANEKDILLAVDKYLNSLDNYNYLQQADYFIYKRETNGAESSRLAIFLEEVQSKGGGNHGTDWTTKLC